MSDRCSHHQQLKFRGRYFPCLVHTLSHRYKDIYFQPHSLQELLQKVSLTLLIT